MMLKTKIKKKKIYETLNFSSLNSTILKVRVIDTKGSEVQSFEKSVNEGNNSMKLNTSNLKGGLYIVQLYDGNSQITKRLQVIK